MKYGIWLDEWFRNYIQPSSKIKTCERYSEIIEKHLKVKLGEYELDELTPLVLQRYVTELLRSGNIVTGKGLAANSVNGIITVIQNSLKLAYTLGELKEYTADKIKRPKTKEKEVSCFTLPEQKKIEQAVLTSKKPKLFGILKQNKRVLLDETISQLQALKVKVNCGNNVIAEINEELAALGKQNSLYSQMLANGVIDEITYHEKADKIKGKIEELRSRRLKIINDDDEETCLEELRQLRRIIDESLDYLTEMDKGLFEKIVKKIYAEEDGSLSFVLQGDLELKVCVEDRNDEQND